MLVKLKQIESGTVLAAAVALVHPPATVALNSGAPPAFDAGTQALSLPATPTVTISGNTATYDPNDGSPPVAYTPTFPADAFLTAGVYSAGAQTLDFTLSNGNTVIVPVSALAGIVATGTPSISMGGVGTPVSPLQASVNIGSGVGNLLVSTPSGLYVPPTVLFKTDTATVDLEGTGNAITAVIKLQPDAGLFTRNFLGSQALATSLTASAQGLGYTEATFVSVTGGGAGPFDVTAAIALFTSSWTSAEILQVEGKINGVFYDQGWSYATPTAYAWVGIAGGQAFDLEAADKVVFTIKLRAGL